MSHVCTNQGVVVKKWEYMAYNRREAPWSEILKDLNALGEQGWEMVTSDMRSTMRGTLICSIITD